MALVVLVAAGLDLWWRVAGEARLGRLVAARVAKATGLEIHIAGVRFEGRTALRLTGTDIRHTDQWSASLRRATLTWKEPLSIRTLRTSSEAIRTFSATGVRIQVTKTPPGLNWKDPLLRWRKQGHLKTVPVRLRDVEITWQGHPRRRLRFDSIQLDKLPGTGLRMRVEGTLPGSPPAAFNGEITGNDDGTHVRIFLRTARVNPTPWLPPAGSCTGTLAGTLSASCPSLVVPEPRMHIAGSFDLAGFEFNRWLEEIGEADGKLEGTGVVVLADIPRAAGTGSFTGTVGGLAAVEVTTYVQTDPLKIILQGAGDNLPLATWLALARPEMKQYLTAGQGNMKLKVRYAVSAGKPQLSARGTGTFRRVGVRYRGRTYEPLAGTATFGFSQTDNPLQPTGLKLQLQPCPGLLQGATVRWVPRSAKTAWMHLSFAGLRLKPVLAALRLSLAPVSVTGRATGRASLAVSATGPDLVSLRGDGRVTGVTLRTPEWGDLTQGRAYVKLRGYRVFVHNGVGVWGGSTLHVHGEATWRSPPGLNLAIRCDDLKLADLQRFVRGKVRLPHVTRPVLQGHVRLKGPVSALRGEGVIQCTSLPVSQQTLGDTVTASFVILWKPSPVESPRLQVTQQKIRLNLIPGFQKAWEDLLRKP